MRFLRNPAAGSLCQPSFGRGNQAVALNAWNEPAIVNLKRVLKKKLGRKITADEQAWLDGFKTVGVKPERLDPKRKAEAEAHLVETVRNAADATVDPKKRRGYGKNKEQ